MDYLLTYSKSDENWYRLLIEAIGAWWMKRVIRNFERNNFLIN